MCATSYPSLLDSGHKLATIFIAAVNGWLAWKIYREKKYDDSNVKESDRRIEAFKVLFLNQYREDIFEFFKEVEAVCSKLRRSQITRDDLAGIEIDLQQLFIEFRQHCLSTLSGIDRGLHDKLLNDLDELQSSLSSNIFESGKNLVNSAEYDNLIVNPIAHHRSTFIESLAQYRG